MKRRAFLRHAAAGALACALLRDELLGRRVEPEWGEVEVEVLEPIGFEGLPTGQDAFQAWAASYVQVAVLDRQEIERRYALTSIELPRTPLRTRLRWWWEGLWT